MLLSRERLHMILSHNNHCQLSQHLHSRSNTHSSRSSGSSSSSSSRCQPCLRHGHPQKINPCQHDRCHQPVTGTTLWMRPCGQKSKRRRDCHQCLQPHHRVPSPSRYPHLRWLPCGQQQHRWYLWHSSSTMKPACGAARHQCMSQTWYHLQALCCRHPEDRTCRRPVDHSSRRLRPTSFHSTCRRANRPCTKQRQRRRQARGRWGWHASQPEDRVLSADSITNNSGHMRDPLLLKETQRRHLDVT
mmetsp:Transcript_30626/g.59049  ORF Transcript_30626/g.59049 Transcript_30626/m.59049 type:complete len:245 (+) Transcript_30626:403-1137(+)